MPKEKVLPPDTVGDIPAWFMTYSDVITLMMTFFILLLTFASSEPEKFERMQVALFGGGGATGLASESDGPLEKDSIVVRERPKSSRVTTRGSQTPPIHSDPALESVNKGLESLKKVGHDPGLTRSIEVSLPALIDSEQNVTELGEVMLRMFAVQLRKGPIFVTFRVAKPNQFQAAVALSHFLAETARVPYGRVAVGIRTDRPNDHSKVQIVVKRDFKTNHDESTR